MGKPTEAMWGQVGRKGLIDTTRPLERKLCFNKKVFNLIENCNRMSQHVQSHHYVLLVENKSLRFGAAVYVYEKMNGGDYTEQQIPM